MKVKTLVIVVLLLPSIGADAQSVMYTPQGQAMPSKVQYFDREAFNDCDNTQIRWLGNAGFLINSRGTTLMVDPLLKGFDMPLLIDMPIKTENVPHLDAILITHSDNDHYSTYTCMDLSAVCKEYHSTMYVDTLMKSQNLNSVGHKIEDTFFVKQMKVTLTSADHLWQNELLKDSRKFMLEDCCGFWIETPDGVIWAPGDTRLMPQFLEMNAPDAIFFDFSDDSWHFGLDNAIKVANTYPNAQLLLSHWGSVDAPNMAVFNADPKLLYDKIVNPQRIRLLQPGELFILTKEPNVVADKHKVRLSRIVVDSTRLEEYNAYLKEEIEASMTLEEGVLTLYATAEKERPNHITILEIYASEEAYKSHIKTTHFIKYKEGTLDMVQELELIDTIPLIEDLKIK